MQDYPPESTSPNLEALDDSELQLPLRNVQGEPTRRAIGGRALSKLLHRQAHRKQSRSINRGVVEASARDCFTKEGIDYIERILPSKGYTLVVKAASSEQKER